ncbi:MAG: class I SAM-dependent methyltransferase [bacterium]
MENAIFIDQIGINNTLEIESYADFKKINFNDISSDPTWNLGEEKELKMHRIHSYPAKFPAFLTTKALSYANKNKITVNKIADIFCGCGTVAFEAKRNNIDFWGCDINPVATMIAKVKSGKYDTELLRKYMFSIINFYTLYFAIKKSPLLQNKFPQHRWGFFISYLVFFLSFKLSLN